MTNDLRPYPEYKDTGLPWLGRVPVHWACLPHRALFEEVKNQGHVNEPLLSVTISKGVIRQADLLADSSKKDSSNLDKSKYKLVEPEDIAYNKMRAWQGAVGVSRYRGIVSPAYIVVRMRTRLNPEYFHYLFRTPGFAKEAERWSYGITSDQWSLRSEHFKMIYSSVPPRDEQDAVVSFIRDLDKKVNRFIRNRRRLIEVLNEQKQAIINRAVTRGLDPNVKLKPSGIDWLGEVPEHWEVKLNQRIFKENIRPHNGLYETPLSLSQQDGLVASCDMKERSLKTSSYDNWKVTIPGDLVVNRFKAHLGVFFAASIRGMVSFHYGVFEPRVPLDTKYYELLYHTDAYRTIYAGRSNGMTVGLQNLSNQNFYSVRTVVPPLDEQQAIVRHSEQATSELSTAIGRAQREIDLIREYRTRLIADVVTGKVDVRGLAPAETLPGDELVDEGIDDEEVLGDDEPEHVEEAADADD